MGKKVCTKQNVERARELSMQDGMTCTKLAEILGVSYSSAWRMINDKVKENNGASSTKRIYTKCNPLRNDTEAIDTIRRMSADGESAYKIAEKIGVDSSTVLRMMKRFGIKNSYAKSGGKKKSNEPVVLEPLTIDPDGESLEEAMARVEASDKAEKQSEEKETVASLYKKGYGADAIATKLGISVNGVYAALDAMPKEEPKFTEKTGVAERMKDALKALMDTDGTTDGTSKDIMEARKNYWADVVAKAQETYETARDRINGIADDMKLNGTEPTYTTANETTMVETDTKDMEDIVVDIMSDAFNGLIRAHGKILIALADGAYIPETGADMFASLDRLSAAEKEVWNVAVNLKKAVQKDDK